MYLFDILLLGAQAFKNGLSMILENKHILKVSGVNRPANNCSVMVRIITITSVLLEHLVQVIHDCRAMAGSLIAQFGVKLTNVFDTQVHVEFVQWPLSL